MSVVFVLLLLASPVCLLIGLIKPTIFNKVFFGNATRKNVSLAFSSSTILFIILTAVTAPKPDTQQGAPIQPQVTPQVSTPTAGQVATPEPTSTPSFYSVTKVVDGDTVAINLNGITETIRMIGIDTPETVDPRKPVQCFGVEASNKAKELLAGHKVRIEKDPLLGDRDKYNRLLAYVFREDGLFFNKEMIQLGFAHEYTYNFPYKYQEEFKAAQLAARINMLGLWATGVCDSDTKTPPAVTTPAAIPPAAVIPIETPPPASNAVSGYSCAGNLYNCTNFKTHAEAQSVYEMCGGVSNDIHRLDANHDGQACESLP